MLLKWQALLWVGVYFTLIFFPLLSVRDLLLRDNLFEIITGSRTFYIQVQLRLSLTAASDIWHFRTSVCQTGRASTAPWCKLFSRAESPGVSVLMLCAVVCQRSAADVWQGLAVWQRGVCFAERKSAQPSVAVTTTVFLPESLPLGEQLWLTAGATSDGKLLKGSLQARAVYFCLFKKKRKHWQT